MMIFKIIFETPMLLSGLSWSADLLHNFTSFKDISILKEVYNPIVGSKVMAMLSVWLKMHNHVGWSISYQIGCIRSFSSENQIRFSLVHIIFKCTLKLAVCVFSDLCIVYFALFTLHCALCCISSTENAKQRKKCNK